MDPKKTALELLAISAAVMEGRYKGTMEAAADDLAARVLDLHDWLAAQPIVRA